MSGRGGDELKSRSRKAGRNGTDPDCGGYIKGLTSADFEAAMYADKKEVARVNKDRRYANERTEFRRVMAEVNIIEHY